MKRFALLVSTIFEPMVVMYVLALVAGKHAQLATNTWEAFIAVITIFFILVFAARLIFTKKDHTNWDVSDRKKRFVPLLLLIVFFGLQYGIVRNLGNSTFTSLFLLLFLWNIGFFLITLRVKLSGHLSVLTLAICQSIAWFGIQAAPFIFLIPLLSWSRLYLKRHTLQEIIIGIVYASTLFLLSAPIIGRYS